MNEQDSLYEMVKEFHQKFGHTVRDSPTAMAPADRAIRYRFMKEELGEFLAAGDIVDQVDALAGLVYFAIGTFVNLGIDPRHIFRAVHAANMRKLWPDGRPRHRPSDGKVVKPDNWHGPEAEIRAEVERQAAARGHHA